MTLEEMLSQSTITNVPGYEADEGRTLYLPDAPAEQPQQQLRRGSAPRQQRGLTFTDFNSMSAREQAELQRSNPSAMADIFASANAVGRGQSPTAPLEARNLQDLQLAEKLARFVPDENTLEQVFMQMTGRELPIRGGKFSYEGITPELKFQGQKLLQAEQLKQQGEMRRKRLDMMEFDPETGGMKMKKPERTEAELRNVGFAGMMAQAEDLMMEHERTNPDSVKASRMEFYSREIPVVGNDIARSWFMDPERQKYRQAQEAWVRAKLRRESGAVIGPQEMRDEIITFFPQPGEGPEVIEQKRKLRLEALKGLRTSSGRAGDQIPYSKAEIIEEMRRRGAR